MYRYFLALVGLFFLDNSGNAQVKISKQEMKTSFPASFIGNWKGTLRWYKQGSKEPQKVMMELRVQPSKDSVGQFTWNLIYGSPSKDNRPYVLKPIDTAKGHWVIDEVNTIIIDQFWVGNTFSGAFSVGGVTIVNNYWREGDKLMVEFISYPTKPLTVTGKGTEEVPSVDSYEIRSYQKAVLVRGN
jgi:hypothetical protein